MWVSLGPPLDTFEEHQLVKARGDDYRDYMREIPYRAFRGIW